jgi:hypothetical protein
LHNNVTMNSPFEDRGRRRRLPVPGYGAVPNSSIPQLVCEPDDSARRGLAFTPMELKAGSQLPSARRQSRRERLDLQMRNSAIDRHVIETAIGMHAEIGHVMKYIARRGSSGKFDVQEISATDVFEPE